MQNKLYPSRVPSYVSIYNSLYTDILSGVYPAGELLPSEQQLADQYNVSRNTLRQALAILGEDGLIIKSRGKGTLVAEHAENVINQRIFNPMTTLCKSPVDSTETHYNFATPTDIARDRLGLTKSEIVLASDVVYCSGEIAVGYLFIQVPTRILEILDVPVSDENSINRLLNTTLFDVSDRQTLVVKLVYANEVESGYLHIEEGHPLLLIESMLSHSAHGALARCKFYFIPEYYKLQFVLQ